MVDSSWLLFVEGNLKVTCCTFCYKQTTIWNNMFGFLFVEHLNRWRKSSSITRERSMKGLSKSEISIWLSGWRRYNQPRWEQHQSLSGKGRQNLTSKARAENDNFCFWLAMCLESWFGWRKLRERLLAGGASQCAMLSVSNAKRIRSAFWFPTWDATCNALWILPATTLGSIYGWSTSSKFGTNPVIWEWRFEIDLESSWWNMMSHSPI